MKTKPQSPPVGAVRGLVDIFTPADPAEIKAELDAALAAQEAARQALGAAHLDGDVAQQETAGKAYEAIQRQVRALEAKFDTVMTRVNDAQQAANEKGRRELEAAIDAEVALHNQEVGEVDAILDRLVVAVKKVVVRQEQIRALGAPFALTSAMSTLNMALPIVIGHKLRFWPGMKATPLMNDDRAIWALYAPPATWKVDAKPR